VNMAKAAAAAADTSNVRSNLPKGKKK